MEPVSLILAALAFGGQAVADEAISDAYQGLKGFIKDKFAGDSEAETALERYEQQPEASQEQLRAALTRHNVGQDDEVVRAAQQVMTHVNPQQASQGKYNTQIAGEVKGMVQGDNAQVTMTFNDKEDK